MTNSMALILESLLLRTFLHQMKIFLSVEALKFYWDVIFGTSASKGFKLRSSNLAPNLMHYQAPLCDGGKDSTALPLTMPYLDPSSLPTIVQLLLFDDRKLLFSPHRGTLLL